ncbi:MAG TPA: DUF4225 domain-containing protein [Epsilonproteobacteria bacterium]|nr:DUF4225 domain-containing protein [Campylobacterota bacterium]
MWKYTSLEMRMNKEMLDKFKKYSKIGGILFILLGIVGVLFPTFMSLGTLAFVAYLMLFAGISAAALTWVSDRSDWSGWLKSFILVVVSLYMIFYPVQGVATLGLLLSIYFFMDSFSSFSLAFSAEGQKHKWLWLFNAVTSMALAIIFIVGWPFTSLWLVGFFVGVSLFFDGIALLANGLQVFAGGVLTATGWGAVVGVPLMAHGMNNLYETGTGDVGLLRQGYDKIGIDYDTVDLGVSVTGGVAGATRQVGTRAVKYIQTNAITGHAPKYGYQTTAGKVDIAVTSAGVANTVSD